MNKRYQVFVSSTYEDLQDERKTVMQTLLQMDCIPCGMELFPASDDDQWTFIKKVIDDCDYYILVLGGRYGSTNQDGMGYTEMEYRYAVNSGKPVAAFVIKDQQQLIGEKIESTDEGKAKLKAFRKLVQKKLTKYWTNKDDLAGAVSLSMNNLIRQFPSPGWIKANEAVDEKSIKEILRLQKENEGLKQQIEETTTKAPTGTESLSQGNDKIMLSLQFRGESRTKYDHYEINVVNTWNDIFSILSPYLINENKELVLKRVLSEYLEKYHSGALQQFKDDKKLIGVDQVHVADENFQVIKVQLKALGLISQSIRSRSVKDRSDYWILTPYGDFIMTQLIAVKRKAKC